MNPAINNPKLTRPSLGCLRCFPSDDCPDDCRAISKGDEEGACLCCGAVWGSETPKLKAATFAGETNVETMAGSSYRSAYSFRVF